MLSSIVSDRDMRRAVTLPLGMNDEFLLWSGRLQDPPDIFICGSLFFFVTHQEITSKNSVTRSPKCSWMSSRCQPSEGGLALALHFLGVWENDLLIYSDTSSCLLSCVSFRPREIEMNGEIPLVLVCVTCCGGDGKHVKK